MVVRRTVMRRAPASMLQRHYRWSAQRQVPLLQWPASCPLAAPPRPPKHKTTAETNAMSTTSEQKAAELRRAALEYHEFPTPGNVAIHATKQMVNQHDLALAHSPGVASACEENVVDSAKTFRY